MLSYLCLNYYYVKNTMNPFLDKQCRDYSSQELALNFEQVEKSRKSIPEWQLKAKENELTRQFSFSNFHQTIDFVNSVAEIAHQQDHHPEMQVSYRHCQVTFSTHSVGGITDNDFICAARVDAVIGR